VNRQQRRAAVRRMKAGTLEDLLREAARQAERMLDEHGEIPPFWFVDTLDEMVMIVTPFNADSPEEAQKVKEAAVQRVREFMREHGARRYVFVSESWSYKNIRRTSDLSKDEEATCFVTNVAGSPIQAIGARSKKDGLLYLESVASGDTPITASPEEIRSAKAQAEAKGFELEFITGTEAEELLVCIQALKNWDGKSASTHPLRNEIVLLSAEDRTQTLVALRDIIRSEDGKPRLSALEIDKDNQPAGGLFTGLLQEQRVMH
jgi:hypothetical protein